MERLNEDWITEGLIDFEYKKYLMLAYLKHVKTNFNDKKLYPFLSDLIFHYQYLKKLQDNKKLIYEQFPKRITKADFKNLKLTYERIINDDDLMSEIKEIVDFALIQFKDHLEEGKELYEFIEEQIEFSPIGVSPINPQEGYLFLTEHEKRDYRVFRYLITLFKSATDHYRGINIEYEGTFTWKLSESYESVKYQLIKKNKELPNPATYLFNVKIPVPFEETYLPVVKRMVMRHVSVQT